ncbi:hypothetical protein MANI_002307 [Metarhizium anisopliae]
MEMEIASGAMGTCSCSIFPTVKSSQVKSGAVIGFESAVIRWEGAWDPGRSGGPRHQQLPAAAGLAIVGPMTGAQVCPCLDKIRICPAASRRAQDRVQDTRSTEAAVKLGVLSLSGAMV